MASSPGAGSVGSIVARRMRTEERRRVAFPERVGELGEEGEERSSLVRSAELRVAAAAREVE
jgi:hypothetical protein